MDYLDEYVTVQGVIPRELIMAQLAQHHDRFISRVFWVTGTGYACVAPVPVYLVRAGVGADQFTAQELINHLRNLPNYPALKGAGDFFYDLGILQKA